MPGSTYSTNLKVELMATGENSGTWGDITNTNLGTALEQAIVGYGNPDYASDANLTISITNSNAAQAARALVLNVTSSVSLTATRELVVPTIQKQYIVQNNTTGSQSITVKTSAGTGITVPNGRKAHLYVNGTDVIQMFDFVDINGGAIDGTPIGASSASTGAFTTLNASGATTLDGNVTLGNASGDNVTVTGTITSNLLFTDNTYDIGASGATRPRNLFLAGAATIGGNLSVGGTLTLTGGVNLNGNVTVGDSSADTLTVNATITSNLLFTDNTYDIGASGATRPRNLFLAGNATIGGNQTLTGSLTVDSTTDTSSATTGSIQTDGGVGIAKGLYVGGNTTLGDASADTVTVNSTITSNLIFTDNTYDIGQNGATRPRYIYLSGGAYITNSGSGQLLGVTSNYAWNSGYYDIGALYVPNMTGGAISLNMGKTSGTNNAGKIAFNYAGGSGSTSNYVELGLFNNDGLLKVFGTGNVAIPSGSLGIGTSAAPNQKLDVWNGAISISNGSAGGSGEVYRFTIGTTSQMIMNLGGTTGFQYSTVGTTTYGQMVVRPNYSVAYPAYSFVSDSGTGIGNAAGAGNVLTFHTNSAEIGRANSSGQWMFGTTNAYGRLTLNGSLQNSFQSSTNSVQNNDGAMVKYYVSNPRDASGGATNRVIGFYGYSADEGGSPAQTMYFARMNNYYGQENINYDSHIYYHTTTQYHYRAYSAVGGYDTWWVKPSTTIDTISGTTADMFLLGRMKIGNSGSFSNIQSVNPKLGVYTSGSTGDGITIASVQNSAGQYVAVGSQYSIGNTNNSAQIQFGIDTAGDTTTYIGFATANGSGSGNFAERGRFTRAGVFVVGDTTAQYSAKVYANGSIAARNGGVDGTFQDAFVAGYTSNYTETNIIQSAVSSAASGSGFRFRVSNGGGSSGVTTVVDMVRNKVQTYVPISVSGGANGGSTISHSVNTANAFYVSADSTSFTDTVILTNSGQATGANFYHLYGYRNANTNLAYWVRGDGTYGSATNTYGGTSDARLKTDIVDAGSQWEDVKAFRIRKYRMIDDPTNLVQLGVVSQELETTSPGLVEDTRLIGEVGGTVKTVKYSILYMKAVKALQEAMDRIEQLESRLTAANL